MKAASLLIIVCVTNGRGVSLIVYLSRLLVESTSYSRWLDMLVAGHNVDVVKAIPAMDNALIMPTPVGLPITLNISAIAAVAIKGQVKIEGITAIRDLISSPRKVSVAVNIRPR